MSLHESLVTIENYFSQVLGVSHIIVPQREVQLLAPSLEAKEGMVLSKELLRKEGSSQPHLIFFQFESQQGAVVERGLFEPQAAALFSKMVQAMKLGALPWQSVEFSHLDSSSLKDYLSATQCKLAVGLGESTLESLQLNLNFQKVRGTWLPFMEGVQVLFTHAPSDLLHQPEKKKQAWEDLKCVMKYLGVG